MSPTYTPAQRHTAEDDEALRRVAERALLGPGEVIDIVLRALGESGDTRQPTPTVSAERAWDEAVDMVCQMAGLRNINWPNPYRIEVTP